MKAIADSRLSSLIPPFPATSGWRLDACKKVSIIFQVVLSILPSFQDQRSREVIRTIIFTSISISTSTSTSTSTFTSTSIDTLSIPYRYPIE